MRSVKRSIAKARLRVMGVGNIIAKRRVRKVTA